MRSFSAKAGWRERGEEREAKNLPTYLLCEGNGRGREGGVTGRGACRVYHAWKGGEKESEGVHLAFFGSAIWGEGRGGIRKKKKGENRERAAGIGHRALTNLISGTGKRKGVRQKICHIIAAKKKKRNKGLEGKGGKRQSTGDRFY